MHEKVLWGARAQRFDDNDGHLRQHDIHRQCSMQLPRKRKASGNLEISMQLGEVLIQMVPARYYGWVVCVYLCVVVVGTEFFACHESCEFGFCVLGRPIAHDDSKLLRS